MRQVRSIHAISSQVRYTEDSPISNINMTPSLNNHSQKNSNEVDDFFLPDFCSVQMVYAVIIIAELLAIVLALAPLDRLGHRWEDLSIISLFVQWVALMSSGVLCLSRPWLSQLSDKMASTATYILLMATATFVSEITYWTAHWITGEPTGSLQLHIDFLLSSLGISAIVSAILLRYFYVQSQRDRSLQARSEARIQALQSRIRPHFLFNSLNTIASLARSQPDSAEAATEDLADLFRGSLADSSYEVKLKDEWELSRRYLHIETLRLRERLNINWSIDELPEDALIPQLTIQPLLENAVYHGIELLPEGGTITIDGKLRTTKDETTILSITITNPVPENSKSTERASNKMAQENVSLRLEALYGSLGKLEVKQQGTEYKLLLEFPYMKERNENTHH